MDYLELVQSLDHTSLAELGDMLLGVRATAGLILGNGVTVPIWSSSLKTILELFVPLLNVIYFLSAAILLYHISDVY